jgi:hypothetical protein
MASSCLRIALWLKFNVSIGRAPMSLDWSTDGRTCKRSAPPMNVIVVIVV